MNGSQELHVFQCPDQGRRAAAGLSWSGAALALAVAIAQQAYAQQDSPQAGASSGGLEEVIVTAQRREERSLDVPISLTTIGADALGKGDVQQLSDIMKLTPALRFDNTGGFSQATIRGVGNAVVVSGSGSNVAIYSDGFYVPNAMTADTELLNVESVQVLKGPQGTLFGYNSTGGAVLVKTSDPSAEESGLAEISYGEYDTQRYEAYATGGSERAAFDVAGVLRKSDGFIDNVYSGTDDDASSDNWAVRLGAKVELTDKASILLRYAHSDSDDATPVVANAFEDNGRVYSTAKFYPGAIVATKPDEVSHDYVPEFSSDTDVIQLTANLEFDSATLTSYTQYREEGGTHHEDFDISSLPVFHYLFDTTDEIFTQEFLLASTEESRLQWTTGLFYLADDNDFQNNKASFGGAPFARLGGSGTETRSISAFGDLTYELREDLFLTGGLRYSYDEVNNGYFLDANLDPVDVPDIDNSELTPRVVLRYKPSDASSVYASYTQGYKAGILNVGGGTLDGIEVDPETIQAYELGYKYSSGPLALDMATYYYDYQDLQVASFDGPRSLIQNAADSEIYGAEAQVRYAIIENLELSVGAAYTHAEYENFDQSQLWTQCLDPVACGSSFGIFVGSYTDASGLEMQRTPEFTGNVGMSYTTDVGGGSLNLSGTLYYTSDFYFDTSEQFKQDGYELLSLRAEWTDPSQRYTLAVYGDNLSDEEYRTQVLPQSFGALSIWGMPATVGGSVRVRF